MGIVQPRKVYCNRNQDKCLVKWNERIIVKCNPDEDFVIMSEDEVLRLYVNPSLWKHYRYHCENSKYVTVILFISISGNSNLSTILFVIFVV